VILTIALLSVASGRFARGTVLVISLLFVQSNSLALRLLLVNFVRVEIARGSFRRAVLQCRPL
jgi:hypothetical protein